MFSRVRGELIPTNQFAMPAQRTDKRRASPESNYRLTLSYALYLESGSKAIKYSRSRDVCLNCEMYLLDTNTL